MLDITKYDYIPLAMPNVKAMWERNKDRNELEFVLDERVKEFILEAAIKFPMWEFITRRNGMNRSKNVVECGAFYVYANRERLGEIWWTYNNRYETVYNIANDRILNKRERGRATKTKDIKKGIKILSKEFGAKTLEERLVEAKANGYSVIVGAANDKEAKFRGDFRDLFEKIMDSLMKDWENVRRMGEVNGADLTLLDRLPTQYEDFQITEDIAKCFKSGKGVVAIIHGSDYAVVEKEEPTKVYGTDTLPEWIKRGIGMLKLVEPKHMIANVGCKIDDASFFVIDRGE